MNATGKNPGNNWFERVPKVELHLHLEGAIPLETLWELVQKYGCDPAIADLADLQSHFVYRDFPHFIDTWIWKNQFLREYEDFTFFSEAFARDLARQNIRYAEVFYSPSDHAGRGLKTQELTCAIRAGLAKVADVEINLIADMVRDRGPENAAINLAEVAEVREQGVIGIGIGGSEQKFPPEPFESVYEQARQLGFHTTAHAGEVAGAESIWGAIQKLHAERIGHGTRAEEDERLLDYLAETRIPLEMCPISNVCTGVVRSIDDHPARRYFERGLAITINSDDPKMFGNSLAEEYRLLEERLGFSRKDIHTLILQGIQASWLSPEQKQNLEAEFVNDPDWLE